MMADMTNPAYKKMRKEWLNKRLHSGHHFNLAMFDAIFKLGMESCEKETN